MGQGRGPRLLGFDVLPARVTSVRAVFGAVLSAGKPKTRGFCRSDVSDRLHDFLEVGIGAI